MEAKTVDDYVSSFVNHLRTEGLSEVTIKNYAAYIRRGLIARDMFEPVHNAPSIGSWQVATKALMHWSSFIGDSRVAEEAKKIPKPTRRGRVSQPVPEDQWKKIVKESLSLKDPSRSILILLTTSGLRVGDVMRLSRSVASRVASGDLSVEIEQKKVKGTRERVWAPGELARDALIRLLRLDNWNTIKDLLIRSTGNEVKDYEIAYHRIRVLLREVCARANVQYARPHRFRHSYASVLLDEGESIKAIQAALGHTSERTTYTYVHVGVQRQKQAADRVSARLLSTDHKQS